MSQSLAQIVDIRPGESTQVAKMALVLFSIIAGHTLMETARDTLFLRELEPKNLALVYVALAGLVLVAARLSSGLVQRFGKRSALVVTLLISAYGTTAFYLTPLGVVGVFALYLWSGLVGSLAAVQFWLLAGDVFTVAQGKRLFGVLAAGGVFGAVGGASAAIALLQLLPTEALLISAVGLLLIGAFALTSLNIEDPAQPYLDKPAQKLSQSVRLFRQHPYLKLIAILSIVATAALLCTDYLFKSAAARSIDPAHLGAFFATYYAILNAVALLFQFVISGSLLKRLGILSAFSVLPLMLLAGGASVLLLGGVFTLVLLTKAADGSLRHSLHRISSELLWMPLPEDVRSGSKSFVDTVVVRFTQAAVAAGLFLLASRGWDTPRVLGLILALLALLWICLTLLVRRPYLSLFRNALQSGKRDRNPLDLDLGAVEVVVESLSNRDPAKAIAAIELLSSHDRTKLIPALILYHESEEVLLAALKHVPSRERKDWLPLTERLLSHNSGTVRAAAMHALADYGNPTVANAGLKDVSPEVRGQAAFLAAESDGGQRGLHESVRQVLDATDQAGTQAKLGLLKSIEHRGGAQWADVLLELATQHAPDLREAIARAAALAPDERLLPYLVSWLTSRDQRDAVRDALVAGGEAALTELTRLLKDETTEPHLRSHLPRSISRFENQAAADVLIKQLAVEPNGLVRYKILRGLGRMAAEHALVFDEGILEEQLNRNLLEHLRMRSYCFLVESNSDPNATEHSLDLLTDLLTNKIDQSWERILRLLQILHPNEDLRSVQRAAESSDKKTRAQALEYVDALTLQSPIPENRQLLGLVLDDLSAEERLNRARGHFDGLAFDVEEVLASLISDRDETLATIAAFRAFTLGLDPLRSEIEKATERHELLASLRDRWSGFGLDHWEPAGAN